MTQARREDRAHPRTIAMHRLRLAPRERQAMTATAYLLPAMLALVTVWLLRDLWPPFRQVAVLFFLGWLLAFLLDPMVGWLVARFPRLPRGPAAAAVFVAIAAAMVAVGVGVGLSIVESAQGMIGRGPSLVDQVVRSLAPLQGWSESFGYPLDTEALVTDTVASVRAELGDMAEDAVGASLVLVSNGLTIVFIAVVMVASKDGFLLFLRRLVPADHLVLFDRFSTAVARSFGGFIRGQFGIAALYGVLVAVISVVIGLPLVPFIGITTWLLQSIPWFGQLLSWIPLVAMTVTFRPDATVPVVAIMLVGWLLVQNVITPRVLGSAVGLNPLAVLAAVFLGGAFAGPLGAVFGVPFVAAIGSVFTAWLDVVRPARRVPPPRGPGRRRRGRGLPAARTDGKRDVRPLDRGRSLGHPRPPGGA